MRRPERAAAARKITVRLSLVGRPLCLQGQLARIGTLCCRGEADLNRSLGPALEEQGVGRCGELVSLQANQDLEVCLPGIFEQNPLLQPDADFHDAEIQGLGVDFQDLRPGFPPGQGSQQKGQDKDEVSGRVHGENKKKSDQLTRMPRKYCRSSTFSGKLPVGHSRREFRPLSPPMISDCHGRVKRSPIPWSLM